MLVTDVGELVLVVTVAVRHGLETQRRYEPAGQTLNIRQSSSHSPVVLLALDRPLHDQEPGQKVDEDSPHPGRHQVGLRGPEVDVEHHHRHTDAEGVEDHGEEDELAQEGDHQGGGGDDLGQQEEEHSEGEEDAD